VNGFKQGHHTAAILLDVEKAFDSVWHNGLKYKLAHQGLPTKMVRLLSSFLTDRTIRVRVRGAVSNPVNLSAGTPQGSVLSPLLFIMYVNDIPMHPVHKVQTSQFADDLGIWTSHKNEGVLNKRLQGALTDLEKWCAKWRVKLNAGKTQLLVISRKPVLPTIKLTLFNVPIQRVETAKLLGVTFDTRLNWGEHIENLVTKCGPRIGLLKVLRGTGWGADPKTLLKLYKQYIRPVIEYGAVVLVTASKTNQERLQRVQNYALKVALNLPWRTNTLDLHFVANVELLSRRLPMLARSTINRISNRSPLYEELLEQTEYTSGGGKRARQKPGPLDFYLLPEADEEQGQSTTN
jgi:hypothetical protein